MVTVVRFWPDRSPEVGDGLDPSDWPPDDGRVIWVDLEAPTDAELALLHDPFGFHPLAIEDCLTREHQPKIEDFGPYVFLIARGLDFNPPVADFQTLKLAAFLGQDWLVTYHRRPMRSVDAVRQKYSVVDKAAPPRGPDRLLYEILDHVVEFYFPILESVEGELDSIEERLFSDPGHGTLDRILETKRRVVDVKRTISPHREVFNRVVRGEFEEFDPETARFYRDLYDSTQRLSDMADSYRDLLSGTLDAYLSVSSHRLNEVMKVLTIFATILLPLTFIAGVYGMNFEHIPELGWRYGYYAVWGVMLLVAGGLLWFFQRKGWL